MEHDDQTSDRPAARAPALLWRRLTIAIPADEPGLPPGLAARRAPPSGCLAYVCRGTQCEAPLADLAALDTALKATEPPGE